MKKISSLLLLLLLGFLLLWPINSMAEDEHLYSMTTNYKKLDSEYHEVECKCVYCGDTIYQKQKHNLYVTGDCKKLDSEYHETENKCIQCGDTILEKSEHVYSPTANYKNLDSDYHEAEYKCLGCGDITYKKEKHDLYGNGNCKKVDSEYHEKEYSCIACRNIIIKKEKHDFSDTTFEYRKKDSQKHERIYNCYSCNSTIYKEENHSGSFGLTEYKAYDSDYHLKGIKCEKCYDFYNGKKEKHSYDVLVAGTAKKVNATYHEGKYRCLMCSATKTLKEEHDWGYSLVSREATPAVKGIRTFYCNTCDASYDEYIPWEYNNPDESESYDITSHSVIYKDSKSITVRMENALKGAILQVKIGNKKFKKKIGKKKKVKVKIKKSPYGKRVSIKLYYKGKLIGKDKCEDTYDHVLYGKNIKKGMSKQKLKYVYGWCEYDRTASASGGWSYWYYDDGSYVGFKNGKVRFWYNAG